MQAAELLYWFVGEQAGKRRTVIVELPLFTSLMRLCSSGCTFYEQVFKSVLFPSEMNYSLCMDGGAGRGVDIHWRVYYIHLALNAFGTLQDAVISLPLVHILITL